MSKSSKIVLVLLRISMGWLMFYAGITKVVDKEWSAAGYLLNAKTFSSFFAWFAQPSILPLVNFVNEWGLTLLGVSLLLGVFVRLSSILGVALMLLYYLPVLRFPFVGTHSYLIDEHIIYALVLLLFAILQVGKMWGLDGRLSNTKFLRSHSNIKSILI